MEPKLENGELYCVQAKTPLMATPVSISNANLNVIDRSTTTSTNISTMLFFPPDSDVAHLFTKCSV